MCLVPAFVLGYLTTVGSLRLCSKACSSIYWCVCEAGIRLLMTVAHLQVVMGSYSEINVSQWFECDTDIISVS